MIWTWLTGMKLSSVWAMYAADTWTHTCRHTNTVAHQQPNLSTALCIPAFLARRCVSKRPCTHFLPPIPPPPPAPSQSCSSWPVCWNGRIWFPACEWAPLCGSIDHCRPKNEVNTLCRAVVPTLFYLRPLKMEQSWLVTHRHHYISMGYKNHSIQSLIYFLLRALKGKMIQFFTRKKAWGNI